MGRSFTCAGSVMATLQPAKTATKVAGGKTFHDAQ